jgi:ABC-type transport system involved in multi-copper enzyme maturation permease subunit
VSTTTSQATAGSQTAASARYAQPSFLGAVRGELLKLSRQRSLWVMLGLGALLFAFVGLAIFSADNVRQNLKESPVTFLYGALDIMGSLFNTGSGIILLICASRLFGMEYSSGTIRILLARGTGRLQLYFAKLVALAVLGVLLLFGFSAAAFGMMYAVALSVRGSFTPLTTLPSVAYRDVEMTILVGLISVGVTILLGSTAAILGRSLSFGIAAAMAFFPADNFGTLVLGIMTRITHIDAWNKATAYLLGPNLNLLASKLEPGRLVRPAFATPSVAVSAEHVYTVVAVYAAVFFIVSIALLLRRDVLE